MSVEDHDLPSGAHGGVDLLLRRAADASVRADAMISAAAADLAQGEGMRLDDAMRAAVRADLEHLTAPIVADLAQHAGRARGGASVATATVLEELIAGGLLDDRALVGELVARARTMLIAERLPATAADRPDRPSLLPRLANGADRVVAGAAAALMAAEARRRGNGADAGRDDLPADLAHRLTWWVAAALRHRPATDATLVDAARRILGAHDEAARVEAMAQRLAAALDLNGDDLAAMLAEALTDRRLALVMALLSQALMLDMAMVREIVLEPGPERLCLALRALDLPRGTIAQLSIALAEADRRRDVDRLAEAIDAVMVLSVEDARSALAPLRLPPAYRAALRALGRA
jgi:hypothetical protein